MSEKFDFIPVWVLSSYIHRNDSMENQRQPKIKFSHSDESSYQMGEREENKAIVVDSNGDTNIKFLRSFSTAILPNTAAHNATTESTCPFFVTKSALDSTSSFESAASSSTAAVVPFKEHKSDVEITNDQPLDLSAKSYSPANIPTKSPSNISSPVCFSSSTIPQSPKIALKVCNSNRHLFVYKAKCKNRSITGKRTYTEGDLQAAIRDIRSGKLGTRKAAVIYSIPRSTLRNKVYKLATEKERTNVTVCNLEDKRIKPKINQSSRNKKPEDFKHDNEDENKDVDEEFLTNEELYSMFQPRIAEIYGNFDPWSSTSYLTNLTASICKNFDVSPLLTRRQNVCFWQNCLTSDCCDSNADKTSFGSKFATPLLPKLIQYVLANSKKQQKRETREKSQHSRLLSTIEVDSMTPGKSNCDKWNNVLPNSQHIPAILDNSITTESIIFNKKYSDENRISVEEMKYGTTFSPLLNSNVICNNSPPLLPPIRHDACVSKLVDLDSNDATTKNIPYRCVQQPNITNTESYLANSKLARQLSRLSHAETPNHLQTGTMRDDVQPTINHSLTSTSASMASISSGKSTTRIVDGGGKGTRPKRGKYRNYDRDSLIEAVQAVQRGEMSVHRAGSHFGVPHSTLEYKVKERHLMRPRKREPKNLLFNELKRKDEETTALGTRHQTIQFYYR